MFHGEVISKKSSIEAERTIMLSIQMTANTTITAQYKELENIEVPDNPTDPKPTEEYVRITFAKGEHGTLEGKTAVDVKKNVEVDLSRSNLKTLVPRSKSNNRQVFLAGLTALGAVGPFVLFRK